MKKKNYINRFVIGREDVISDAVNKCLDKMFRASYPSITLEQYKKKHKGLSEEERGEMRFFEAHYLPHNIYKAIEEDFINAYEFKSPLPDVIDILKGYFKAPVVDVWVEDKDIPGLGRRSYEHPEPMSEEGYKEAEKFLDMANEFYNWNRDLNMFCFNVSNYSPCSNRETVEHWWHEHGDPDFKLPDDSWWVDEFDENNENEEE